MQVGPQDLPATATVNCPRTVEVAAGAVRKVRVTAMNHLEGELGFSVRFVCETAGDDCGEVVEQPVLLKTGPAGAQGVVRLRAALRQSASRVVSVPNPLAGMEQGQEVQFSEVACENPFVRIEQLTGGGAGAGAGASGSGAAGGAASPEAEIPFRVTFTPLHLRPDSAGASAAAGAGGEGGDGDGASSGSGGEQPQDTEMVLVSPQLGRFRYVLKLLASVPASEKPLQLKAPLGARARALHPADVRGSAGPDVGPGTSGSLKLLASVEGPDAGAFLLGEGAGDEGADSLELPLEFGARAMPEGRAAVGALGDASATVPVSFCPFRLGPARAILVLRVSGG